MRTTEYEVVLWLDGEQVERHQFELTYDEKGWYTSIGSIEAFGKRESERLLTHLRRHGTYNLPGKRCHVKSGIDIQLEKEMWERMKKILDIENPFDKLSVFKHNSVWDFYKAIGYDYKKKKYIA